MWPATEWNVLTVGLSRRNAVVPIHLETGFITRERDGYLGSGLPPPPSGCSFGLNAGTVGLFLAACGVLARFLQEISPDEPICPKGCRSRRCDRYARSLRQKRNTLERLRQS